jgi:hypothetical protein
VLRHELVELFLVLGVAQAIMVNDRLPKGILAASNDGDWERPASGAFWILTFDVHHPSRYICFL